MFNPSQRLIQQMDYQSGIIKLQKEITAPKQLMDPEMDLVMSYRHIKSFNSRYKATPIREQDIPTKITLMEKENIQCDEEVKEYF